MVELIFRLALKDVDVDRLYVGIGNLRNHLFDERSFAPPPRGYQYCVNAMREIGIQSLGVF